MLVDENKDENKDVHVDLVISFYFNMCLADAPKTPMEGVMTLTVEEVAAESRGKMPPQAMMRLSTTWEMRCMLLWTNTTFSLLFTKSRMVFVE